MRLIPLIIVLIFSGLNSFGQEKFWIYFADEKEIDQPIDYKNLELLEQNEIQVIYQSQWLNAVSACLTEEMETQLSKQTEIKEIQPVRSIHYENHGTELNFTYALEQINAEAFTAAGLSGKNIKIGILDGGFSGAIHNNSLKEIFQEERIMESRDYIANDDILTGSDQSSKDWHGTAVWQYIAGEDTELKSGLATDAVFYLARTEHGDQEFRGEEDNWIAALEWLNAQGVRLVNSSLGYSNGFNDPEENYSPSQMDGKSTAISRAAQIAVEKKNMILVVSAGNDGNDASWQTMTAPADAKGVISVGATQMEYWIKAGYSAIGPDFTNYLKPNLVCYSGSGTSFSAPVITGIIACMLEKDSMLSSRRIQQILQKSGHLYPYGNNYLGYGVPDCKRILSQMEEQDWQPKARLIKAKNNYFPLDLENSNESIILFHKKSRVHTLHQKVMNPTKERIIIHRPREVAYTTVHMGDQILEIQWK